MTVEKIESKDYEISLMASNDKTRWNVVVTKKTAVPDSPWKVFFPYGTEDVEDEYFDNEKEAKEFFEICQKKYN